MTAADGSPPARRAVSLPDAMFLLAEQPEQAMRIGGLCAFAGDGRSVQELRALHRARIGASTDVALLFTLAPASPRAGSAVLRGWRSVPVRPLDHTSFHDLGGASDAELLDAVAELHKRPLARDRPMWEAHYFYGLADGGFATYHAMHHSLIDGVEALRLATRAADGEVLLPWEPVPRPPRPPRAPGSGGRPSLRALRTLLRAPVDRRLRSSREWRRYLGPSRRLVAFDVPVAAVRRPGDGTFNNALLQACGAALRDLDLAAGRPPAARSAMVPVSLRDEGDAKAGNVAAAVRCDLHVQEPDEAVRLAAVVAQMQERRAALQQVSASWATVVSALVMSRQLASCLLRRGPLPDAGFDLVVSNLRGPAGALHQQGSRMRRVVPLSLLGNGQPVNITVLTLADTCTVTLYGDPGTVDVDALAAALQRRLVRPA